MSKDEESVNFKIEAMRAIFLSFIFSICCSILSVALVKFATVIYPPAPGFAVAQKSAKVICFFIMLFAMLGRLMAVFKKSTAAITLSIIATLIFRACFNWVSVLMAHFRFLSAYPLWSQRHVERPEKWLLALFLFLSFEIVVRSDTALQRSMKRLTKASKRIGRV